MGDQVTGTGHPMIMRAEEEFPAMEQLSAWLGELEEHCDQMNCDAIKAVLLDAVSGFEEHEGMHDHLWRKQRANRDKPSSNVQELFPERSADK